MGRYQRIEETSLTHQSDSLLRVWEDGDSKEDRLATLPHTQGIDSPCLSNRPYTSTCASLMLIVCSLGEIFRFTKEDLKQTSLKTENRRILCCLFITQKSSLLFKNDYLPCLSVTLKESQVYRSSHYEFSSVRVIITSRLCFGSWLAYNWSLEHFSFPCCFSRLLTEHFYLTSVDRVGSLCTRPHRKHCHLCNYPGLFLGLWKQ